MAKVEDYGNFGSAQVEDATNIIWSSQGVAGSGKTHFLLTAPEPIGVFLFDPGGLKGLMANDLFKTKDVRVVDYSKRTNLCKIQDESERAVAATELLQQFEEDWALALRKFRTVGIDKEESLWEVLQASEETKGKLAFSFSPLNMRYRGWFAEAENAGINLGAMCGVKAEWSKSGPTGKFRTAGSKNVPGLVQICLEHAWDNDQREFTTTILEKCRLGNAQELIGEQYQNLDFLTLAMTLYPNSSVSDWE